MALTWLPDWLGRWRLTGRRGRPGLCRPARAGIRPRLEVLEARDVPSPLAPANTFAVGAFPSAVAVADFNGDGNTDIVTANAGGTVSVLLGDGHGSFQAPQTFSTGNQARSLAVGDFWRDGNVGLVVGSTGGAVNVLRSSGDGTFQAPQTVVHGDEFTSVAVADLSSDGNPGIVVADGGLAVVRVLVGNGDGTFRPETDYRVGAFPIAVAVADFNGNGNPDVVVANNEAGTVSVLLDIGVIGVRPAPAVRSVVVNDGSAQRSMVTSLTVTFDGIVTPDPGAFELTRQRGGTVAVNVSASVVNGQTVAALTFSGADIIGGSLPDGRYTLTVRANKVHNAAGQTLAADHVTPFFRLFGDSSGNGAVGVEDFIRFASTYGKREGDPAYLTYFDYNGDGRVDFGDLVQLLLRIGKRV